MTNFNETCEKVANFLAAYTGEEPEQDTIEVVANRVQSALDALSEGNRSYYQDLLESSSTYVQTDLSADELEDYTDMLEDYVCSFA